MKKPIRNLLLSLTLVIGVVGLSAAHISEGDSTTEFKDKQYYQVVMIWMKDPAKFQDYAGKMGPIVAKYGGNGERIISPVKSIYAGNAGIKQPDMINIVYYDSKEAYEKFENDPEFQKIKHLRTESIDMAGIGGFATEGEIKSGAVADRLYMLEFAYFKDGNSRAYNSYKKKSKSFYEKHGLFTERVFKPVDVFGNIEMPDRVSVLYHDRETRKEELQNDPRHKEIEDLYAKSISDLIWIEGKAAFVNMD